jgi:hypothetical protein
MLKDGIWEMGNWRTLATMEDFANFVGHRRHTPLRREHSRKNGTGKVWNQRLWPGSPRARSTLLCLEASLA